MKHFELCLFAGVLALSQGHPALAAPPAGTGLCRLMSGPAVAKALHVEIVRVETGESGADVCEYSVKGKPSSASTDHGIAMVGALSGQKMDPAAQKMMQGFGNAVLGGAQADQPEKVRHPGEVPVLVVDVHSGDAAAEMKLNRQTLGMLSPVTPIEGLGDEAFATSQSIIMVRKGKQLLRMTYTTCACTTQDVVPLARQAISAL